MAPTRRAVLGGLLALPLLGATPSRSAGRKLILVSAYGGWDTTYALDPKPGAPAFDAPPGSVRLYGDLPVLSWYERPSVDAFFERAASISAVLRGISVQSLSHPQCTRRITTGVPTAGAPDVGAIAAATLGSDRSLPYLVASPAAFSGPYAAQSAHTGTTNQLAALITPELEPPSTDPDHVRFAAEPEDEDRLADWLRTRAERAATHKGRFGDDARRVADYSWSLERAEDLPHQGEPFAKTGAPASFEDQAGQAVRALAAGLSWSAAIDSELDFDTHTGNDQQSGLHETLFQRLGTLLTLLEDTPGESAGSVLLDETAVVVISEMTRTPRLTSTGGKDHWPFATMLVFGAGVRGGRGYGATDDTGVGLTVDHATGELGGGSVLAPQDVLAGLLELAGVDPAPHYPDAEVFRAFLA